MPPKQQSGNDRSPSSATPAHVAIIMDGSGRWAEQRGLSRLEGHRAGTEKIRAVVHCIATHHVPFLTLYAFSTENWTRPRKEIQGLMGILERVLLREVDSFDRQQVRLNHLGRLDRLPPKLRRGILEATRRTRENTGLTLNVALDYGSRDEILQAVRRIVEAGVSPEEVTEPLFQQHLYTSSMPDPDLIIRTGGEMRLSNFMLWQAAYSEYYATPILWPDFDEEEILKALGSYRQRQRRFGGLLCPPEGG